jgi:RNA polymerase sigma-70 factor (ECF subfamily)
MAFIGRFQLEAAIQSAHVARRRDGIDNWAAVVKLYDGLLALTGSPVAAINRAVALAELEGAGAGLAALDAVSGDPRVREYQPYWAARADLLARTGAHSEARAAYEIAIGMERDPSVRQALEQRRSRLDDAASSPPQHELPS